MRLLTHDGTGGFRLNEDFTTSAANKPTYAILSHTWGPQSQEVTFRDVVDGTGKDKAGYGKIRFCASQARRDDLLHFWIDTCCIDKSNSAELSEAQLHVPVVPRRRPVLRLALRLRVRGHERRPTMRPRPSQQRVAGRRSCGGLNVGYRAVTSGRPWQAGFRASRWFTRGWTLQELLAPVTVQFFARDATPLGDKTSLRQTIHEITGIPVSALFGEPLSSFGVQERFRWAEGRRTTRDEDTAYCLLGIFGVLAWSEISLINMGTTGVLGYLSPKA